MAQKKLLFISASDGTPTEHNSTTDDVTFLSYTVDTTGQTLSQTGLDMANTDISDVADVSFNDPSVNTINQTAGSLVIDDIMAKDRNNLMETVGAVLFPLVTDVAGEVDAFKIPHIAGAPTATPAFSSDAGYLVYDDTNNNLYVWNGAQWDNLNTVAEAEKVTNNYLAEVAILARDVVYISSANNVSPAIATAPGTAYAIGLAKAAAAPAANVPVISEGIVAGFSGLTPGARYFLSAATAGEITATTPTGTGNVIMQIGYAKSATELHLQLDTLGRRA